MGITGNIFGWSNRSGNNKLRRKVIKAITYFVEVDRGFICLLIAITKETRYIAKDTKVNTTSECKLSTSRGPKTTVSHTRNKALYQRNVAYELPF